MGHVERGGDDPTLRRCVRSTQHRDPPGCWENAARQCESLWLQAKAVQQVLKYLKIKGEENPADGLTKHVKRELLDKYLKIEDLEVRLDRAGASLELAGQ